MEKFIYGELLNIISSKRNNSKIKFNMSRRLILQEKPLCNSDNKHILYLMMRECRVQDNWALIYAQQLAIDNQALLHIAYVEWQLRPIPRKMQFVIEGLEAVEKECIDLGIGFNVVDDIGLFIDKHKIGTVVCDFSPLKEHKKIVNEIILLNKTSIHQVDAHNVIPCWLISDKQEHRLQQFKLKVKEYLHEYLTQFPQVIPHPYPVKNIEKIDFKKIFNMPEVAEQHTLFKGGYEEGIIRLSMFCTGRILIYDLRRNDPNAEVNSNLSPWINSGQISAQRCIIEVSKYKSETFLKGILYEREIAENFCFYNQNYDNINGAPDWARKSLDAHKNDRRKEIYTQCELEACNTSDKIWNSIQYQIISEGYVHGFLRKYWAKKILEWTLTVEDAIKITNYFNDKYCYDGNDPCGYAGVLWALCGLHDRAWKERRIYGKIRRVRIIGNNIKTMYCDSGDNFNE